MVDVKVIGQAVYGDSRSDVQKAYPQYKNGNAGFHFTLDTTKLSDGKHTVTIKETGKNGRVNSLPDKNITIANSRGYVDKPVTNTTLIGTSNVSGWFLDMTGVSKIDILVDGSLAGQAVYSDSRPDVLKAYPQYHNGNAGFHFSLNTAKYIEG
ncbi:hypothetical protein [Neobacillus cucumis]|uniref:hypothetical protein n=1 Tax=Neobacillus cucumis TaxID=1740721 RepID=UPI002E1CB3A7|nr:Ig-like domain-containing protein [Neobacillus cucumis]